MGKRILIVEDDAALARVLRDNLIIDGFDVKWVDDGDEAVQACRAFLPDLVLLDVMLPGRSGFELCRVLRQGGRTPVIIVSVRDQKSDRVKGLELGADDYVTKPYYIEELVARIHAVLRRVALPIERIRLGEVVLDFRTLRATGSAGEIHLTHREFEVLRYLATRRERVVHRDELMREVWGELDVPSSRPVDHAIARIRKKVEVDPHDPRFIHTVRGDGYSLTFDVVP